MMIGCRGWPAGLLFLLSAALILGLYLARDWALPGLAKWLDVGAQPRPSEYLMILGGDNRFRPAVAASLWKSGYVGQILLPPQPVSEDRPHEQSPGQPTHPTAKQVLQDCGVPLAAITTLNRDVSSTYQEAQALGEFLQSRPGARVIVVTSDYHTRRARWAFRQVLAVALRGRLLCFGADRLVSRGRLVEVARGDRHAPLGVYEGGVLPGPLRLVLAHLGDCDYRCCCGGFDKDAFQLTS